MPALCPPLPIPASRTYAPPACRVMIPGYTYPFWDMPAYPIWDIGLALSVWDDGVGPLCD